MSRRRLLREMDMAELAEWEEFWRREPFGDEWRQMARQSETICIANGVKKRDGGRLTEEDFMPAGYLRKSAAQTDATIEGNLMQWASRENSAQKKKKK